MGVLSQALANLVAAEQSVNSISGLPPDAQQIQAQLSGRIPALVSEIQAMQQACQSFVEMAIPQLDQIDAMLRSDDPVPAITAKITIVQDEASASKTTVDQASDRAGSLAAEVLAAFSQLAGVEVRLRTQMTSLQGRLGTAQGQEAAARKKYYYLLALGPFGLIGLAAALALHRRLQSEVNGYESQIHGLNASISSSSAMQTACQLMVSTLQNLVTKVSGLRNSVNFVASDIFEINTDLTPPTIEIMVKAAITEVNTLAVDVS